MSSGYAKIEIDDGAPIDFLGKLASLPGVVVRQETQVADIVAQNFGMPYNAKNRYAVCPLPADKVVASSPEGTDHWKPTSLDLTSLETFMLATEESSVCTRIWYMLFGIGNLRPLQLRYRVNRATGEAFFVKRCVFRARHFDVLWGIQANLDFSWFCRFPRWFLAGPSGAVGCAAPPRKWN
jgi:hypothetical protein